jgi:hypothetical protein
MRKIYTCVFTLLIFSLSLTACSECEDNVPAMTVQQCEKESGEGTAKTAVCIKENLRTSGQILETNDSPHACYRWYIGKYKIDMSDVQALENLEILPATGFATLEPSDITIPPLNP